VIFLVTVLLGIADGEKLSSIACALEASSLCLLGHPYNHCRPCPNFHYKYYSEKQPLRLSTSEVEECIYVVCFEGSLEKANIMTSMPLFLGSQTGRLAMETTNVEASVLIKLVINIYMADSWTAALVSLSMLEGRLSSPPLTVGICALI
jgi:hypothetical protein